MEYFWGIELGVIRRNENCNKNRKHPWKSDNVDNYKAVEYKLDNIKESISGNLVLGTNCLDFSDDRGVSSCCPLLNLAFALL